MSKGLEVGAVLPDFQLPDENGVMHSLSELQGDDALILMLGRGEHCPRERQHQMHMVAFQQWAPVAFTRLVTILPNDLHDTYKMKIATGAWWTYLADTELTVQRAFEIDEYTDSHHAATVPHTVVLGPGLRVEKVYVGYWYWGRPSIYQLWQDLAELFRKTKPDFDPTTAEARAAFAAAQPPVSAPVARRAKPQRRRVAARARS
jgi:peroxiredoxin